jgi:hypothetical protein
MRKKLFPRRLYLKHHLSNHSSGASKNHHWFHARLLHIFALLNASYPTEFFDHSRKPKKLSCPHSCMDRASGSERDYIAAVLVAVIVINKVKRVKYAWQHRLKNNISSRTRGNYRLSYRCTLLMCGLQMITIHNDVSQYMFFLLVFHNTCWDHER